MEKTTGTDSPDLIYPTERPLFFSIFALATIFWVGFAIASLGIGLIVIVLGGLLGICLNCLFIAQIKGYGIRVSATQYPDLYAETKRISDRIGLTKLPSVYVFNGSGMINAFALKVVMRDFVVITTDLLVACDNDKELTSFILGHEIGHHVRKHTLFSSFFAPVRLVPWLYTAYSRACEYTCDAYGARFGASSLEKARQAVAVLATANYGRSAALDAAAYEEQARDVSQFWPAVVYTNSSHPFTALRFSRIRTFFEPNQPVVLPKANLFGMVLGPIFSFGFLAVIYIGLIAGVAFASVLEKTEKDDAAYEEDGIEYYDDHYCLEDGECYLYQEEAENSLPIEP
ncbi:MAG: putative peptidase [Parcubacteria bacterium C7867-004]|nr:MAG: putative peptidase [Parcubacteria bacterium C7867-004]